MKHLKKTLSLALAVLLALGISVQAFAAVEDTGFSDVDAGAWYAEAVMYCREHGLMNGTSNTTFAPESSLTRAMLVTVLYRSAGSPAVTGTDNFSDTMAGAYYADAVLVFGPLSRAWSAAMETACSERTTPLRKHI